MLHPYNKSHQHLLMLIETQPVSTLFISDLHLSQDREDITQAFFKFLENHAKTAQQLYILGDFFDHWIGDDYVQHKDSETFIHAVISKLASLQKSGVELFFMHGNRDFLVGDTLMSEIHGKILKDPTIIKLGDTPTLLMHGDSLCTDDIAYMQFRSLARTPQWIDTQLAKPVTERIQIAAHLRQASAEKNKYADESILDVNEAETIKIMQNHEVLQLIHGHTHRPAIHTMKSNNCEYKRYVLGDWHKQGWYLEYSDDKLALKSFKFK